MHPEITSVDFGSLNCGWESHHSSGDGSRESMTQRYIKYLIIFFFAGCES